MMTHEARVTAVMERVRARVQLRKQRRMAGVLVLAALEIKAVKNYKRRVSEQPVVTVAEGEGAAE